MTTGRMPTESRNIRWPADLDTDDYDGWYMGRGRSVQKAVKAAMEGDLDTIRRCIDAEPELVDCNIRYREPLYFAVGNNHLEVARFLVESGAEITYKSGNRHHQRLIRWTNEAISPSTGRSWSRTPASSGPLLSGGRTWRPNVPTAPAPST